MKVYVAIQEGVYRHDIVAVCTDQAKAEELAKDSVDAEYDHYHSVEIVEMDLDGVAPELVVGSVRGHYDPPLSRTYCWTNETERMAYYAEGYQGARIVRFDAEGRLVK